MNTTPAPQKNSFLLTLAIGAILGFLLVLVFVGLVREDNPIYETGGPKLVVSEVVSGLDNPWDLAIAENGDMYYTQRDTKTISVYTAQGENKEVLGPVDNVWVSGETGLMAIELDPKFNKTKLLYTCSGWLNEQGDPEIRVNAWEVQDNYQITTDPRSVVSGIPVTSGRHGGCALVFTQTGDLLVGTGDAADEENPQNLNTLGGKTLLVDPQNGQGAKISTALEGDGRIYTYGHRNVQGLAVREDGTLFSAEHGPDKNDEVNQLDAGVNYGWAPGSGYDENVPMTDFDLPGRVQKAVWSSGDPTIATSGIAFLPTNGWGEYSGGLVLGNLKDTSLRVLILNEEGTSYVEAYNPPALNSKYGRLRNPVVGPDGYLYVTTDNGDGDDKILKVAPQE